jgi:tRNA (mo5U34)-methyltransferase
MDRAAKQAELDAITWYHEFDFGNGLRTKTHCHQIESHRRVWGFVESQLAQVDFCGKSVLDIGAWDGYWSFYAEKRGARSVLASDDLGQNWSQGRGIHLAKELLGSSVEIDQDRSVYDLTALNRTFDVILFLGVFYHLHDPFYALAQIRHCCHHGTVVAVNCPVGRKLGADGALYNFDDHNCEWLPGEGALKQLLRATYFTEPTEAYYEPPPPAAPPGLVDPVRSDRLGWRWRLKTCGAALRGSRPELATQFETLFPREQGAEMPRLASRLGMFICRPHEGEAGIHVYKPPFGLHRYDPRFRTAPARRVA